jgi:hypothetical protein
MPNQPAAKRKTPTKQKNPDDFESVAKRLECDPDMEKFDAKLKKIAKATAKAKPGK